MRVSGMTPEEEDRGKRHLNHRLREAANDVRVASHYFGGCLLSVLALVVAAAAVWVIYKWLAGIVASPVKLNELVMTVGKAGVVALATIAVQYLFKQRDG